MRQHARRAAVYPQVEPGAASLVNVRLVAVPAAASVADALAVSRRRDAAAVSFGGGAVTVLREDLARAEALGLPELPAVRLERPLPVVEARSGEVSVYRLLAEGAPIVVVRERGAVVGGVTAAAAAVSGTSLIAVLGQALPATSLALLLRIGALAEAQGGRAFLVGGVVRDAVAGAKARHEAAGRRAGRGVKRAGHGVAGQSPRHGAAVDGGPSRRDLDIVVEGDGLAVARLLAAEVGGTVVEHGRFLTASVRGPVEGRIDIATSRSERYATPGALPSVMPAGIREDLRRRDFTLNAMAVELASGAFTLLDPLGGRADLGRRRLRILHPLSFVEDPTRIFRAARYAARLSLAPDPWTTRGLALALDLAPYDALSGQRLTAELDLIAREEHSGIALRRLAITGALRLLEPRYRFTRTTAARLEALHLARAWAASHSLVVAPLELVLLAVLGDQPVDVAAGALRRLSLTGEPAARLLRVIEAGPSITASLATAPAPSAILRSTRGWTHAQMAWLWLSAAESGRRALDRAVTRSSARGWLGGDELVALGVPRGPALARLLDELRDRQVDETIADRAAAVAHVRRWIAGGLEAGSAAKPAGADDIGKGG